MKSVNLNFLEPSGPLQACNGTVLPLQGLSSYPPRHREYQGGWRLQRRYAKSKSQKTASVIEIEPLNVVQSAHIYLLLTTLNSSQ